MKYINEFLRKKKPETFMDYAPGEIPNKSPSPKPLTLGEVAPKATERVVPRVTIKEESTYTTSNKDLQNIHRNRTYNSYRKSAETNVGAGVSARPHSRTNSQETTQFTVGAIHESPAKATTLRKTPTQTPHPIKLPYRPSLQGPPKMTKLPYIPAQDGPPKMTQYGKQTAPAYDSPVKIVGDNVTEKDYEDFWEAFRKESTADKFDWVTNTAKPQNTAKRQYVTGENGRKINPELNADKIYEDDFWGQVAANYQEGNLELEEQQAKDEYNRNPTAENKKIAEDISAALKNFRQRNSEVLENDVTPAWIVREFAGELPEIIEGVEDGIRQKDLGLIQDAFSDNMDEIEGKAKDIHYSRNQYNVNLPENINEAEKMGWRDDVPVDCHNFTAPKRDNVKFVHSDGREAIFDASGMHSVTSDEDMPTFNFYNPKDEPIRHGVTDVVPWFLWGNTPNDTTNHFERALTAIPIYYKVH